MLNIYIDPYVLSPFEASPFFHKLTNFAKSKEHRVAIMGFKSHIPWNALSYLEDKAKITITHNHADLEGEKKHAVLLAGYLKKGIELVAILQISSFLMSRLRWIRILCLSYSARSLTYITYQQGIFSILPTSIISLRTGHLFSTPNFSETREIFIVLTV